MLANPTGGIFALDNELDATFVPLVPVEDVQFMIEARGDNVLEPEVLRELGANEVTLRDDPDLDDRLLQTVHPTLGFEIDGIWSLADAVDISVTGGLENASDASITDAVNSLLDSSPALQQTLASSASNDSSGWTSPAIMSFLLFDNSGLEDPDNATGDPDQEEYLRDVQDVLRGDETTLTVLGLAIDPALTQFDGAATAIPFLLFAVIAIVFVVGVVQKSYWAAALVGAGLGLVMVFMNAVLTLTFRGTSLLVALVVPIAVISFGVDFFIHSMGRIREQEEGGHSDAESYQVGVGAVIGALLLAMGSSVVAFSSNTVSGIEAIIDFGIAAAAALIFSFILLGLVAPRIVLAIEAGLGQARNGGRHWSGRLGFVFMSVFAGLAVALLATAPEPAFRLAAAGLWVVFVSVFVWGAYRIARRRAPAGVSAARRESSTDGRIEWVGGMVSFLARYRWFTLTGALAVGVLALVSALNVDSGSEFRDFFSSDTDLVSSLDLAEEHFADFSVNETMLFVEGDLVRPEVLAELDDAVESIDTALPGMAVARRLDGTLDRQPDAAVIARLAVADPVAGDAVAGATGVVITDADGDGYPDGPEQVRAVFDVALVSGLPATAGRRELSAPGAQSVLTVADTGYGTIVEVSVPTSQSVEGVNRARDAINAAIDDLGAGSVASAFSRIELAGDAAVERESRDAFTKAMLIALPIAVVLCTALAWTVMRSMRFAIVAVAPILLVVVMLYGFMTVAGFKVNPVSSTLAAIAVGIGIDFSTHFTMRYREELARFEPLTAVREAGAGTGGALILSALSSIIGFAIMGLAPMPAFAWFGQLTAVMIFMSVAVALLILPSLLVTVTPKTVIEPAAHVDSALEPA